MKRFDKICKDIKAVKIQGAYNIAIAGLEALKLKSDYSSVKKLRSLRPNEPKLFNAINYALMTSPNEAILKLKLDSEVIFENAASIIKGKMKIYTHCHSSTVMGGFKLAKKQNKKFVVLNTETRPLFQGRITSRELVKFKIPNEHYVDSGMRIALKKADLMMIGSDVITKKNIYNKIGSGLACQVAKDLRIPVYVCSHSWTFYPKEDKIEKRPNKEIWDKASKDVKIQNFAFEKIEFKLIKGIVSELGVLKPKQFVKKVKKEYPWLSH